MTFITLLKNRMGKLGQGTRGLEDLGTLGRRDTRPHFRSIETIKRKLIAYYGIVLKSLTSVFLDLKTL